MPNLNISGGLAQRHNIPSIIDSVIPPIYTSDATYTKFVVPMIRIDDRDTELQRSRINDTTS